MGVTCPSVFLRLRELAQVRRQVEAGNEGTIVAIDMHTGDFQLAENTLTASKRLLARHPEAQIWCIRIGYLAVHRFGQRGTDVRIC